MWKKKIGKNREIVRKETETETGSIYLGTVDTA